ncbi:MAG: hypothetical protein ACYDCC_06655 [Actinomycetota bacterium]
MNDIRSLLRDADGELAPTAALYARLRIDLLRDDQIQSLLQSADVELPAPLDFEERVRSSLVASVVHMRYRRGRIALAIGAAAAAIISAILLPKLAEQKTVTTHQQVAIQTTMTPPAIVVPIRVTPSPYVVVVTVTPTPTPKSPGFSPVSPKPTPSASPTQTNHPAMPPPVTAAQAQPPPKPIRKERTITPTPIATTTVVHPAPVSTTIEVMHEISHKGRKRANAQLAIAALALLAVGAALLFIRSLSNKHRA